MPEPLCPLVLVEFPWGELEACPLLVDWALPVLTLTTYGLASFQPPPLPCLFSTAGVGNLQTFFLVSWCSVGFVGKKVLSG